LRPQQDCSNVRCRLLPVKGDISSEFSSKASEKGVRLVYLNCDLEIGNNTYHPLELEDEFLPERWVWAKSISEPMLSLSYDYDVLSLGLLNYQGRRMSIKLEDQPSGCLAGLKSPCQDRVVGRMLLQNVVNGSSSEMIKATDVVCVAFIDQNSFILFEGNINYRLDAVRK